MSPCSFFMMSCPINICTTLIKEERCLMPLKYTHSYDNGTLWHVCFLDIVWCLYLPLWWSNRMLRIPQKGYVFAPFVAFFHIQVSPFTKINTMISFCPTFQCSFHQFPGGHVKDYLLEDAASVYYALFREMAHLAAWDHQGRYDSFFGPMQKCHVTLMKWTLIGGWWWLWWMVTMYDSYSCSQDLYWN